MEQMPRSQIALLVTSVQLVSRRMLELHRALIVRQEVLQHMMDLLPAPFVLWENTAISQLQRFACCAPPSPTKIKQAAHFATAVVGILQPLPLELTALRSAYPFANLVSQARQLLSQVRPWEH